MIDSAGIWQKIVAIRARGPLVNSVTNFVVMDFITNTPQTPGVSPVVARAPQEVAEVTAPAGFRSGGPGSVRGDSIDAEFNGDESIVASSWRGD